MPERPDILKSEPEAGVLGVVVGSGGHVEGLVEIPGHLGEDQRSQPGVSDVVMGTLDHVDRKVGRRLPGDKAMVGQASGGVQGKLDGGGGRKFVQEEDMYRLAVGDLAEVGGGGQAGSGGGQACAKRRRRISRP